MKKEPMFRKSDIVLAMAILVIGIGSLFLLRSDAGSDSTVNVYIGEDFYGSYSLSKDQTLDVISELGRNTIEIKGGKVRITDSDCPGEDCIRMGSISKEGQIIICAPHKLSVIIEASEGSGPGNGSGKDSESTLDSVTY